MSPFFKDARVVRAAFFAPLPGSSNPAGAFYQIAFRESTDKKLLPFEFHGKHKRLPISVNSTYFDNGRWIFTDEKVKNKTSAPKRKASSVKKPRAKRALPNQDDIEEDNEEEEEEEDDQESVAGSLPPMQQLEEWANNMDQDLAPRPVQVYEDDLRSNRSSRRRLSPSSNGDVGGPANQSLYARLGLRLGESSTQRPVDFATPAPAPSESGFSATSIASSVSSNATARQLPPVRRSARLNSVAPSEASTSASSTFGVGHLQVDNDMAVDDEQIFEYQEDPNFNNVHIKREDYDDEMEMDGQSSNSQDEEMYA